MNENTCVAIQCWEGDADQIMRLLPYWQHHGVPIYLISPEDAPVGAWPGTQAMSAGKRGWAGPHTIDRQIEHFKLMYDLPFDYYFYTDADAICLSAEFPGYVYEPNTFWSNMLSTYDFWTKVPLYAEDERYGEREDQVREACKYLTTIDDGTLDIGKWHDRCPVVMQPPYFFSKDVLGKLIDVAENDVWKDATSPPVDFPIPFIDWFYPALVRHSDIHGRPFGNDGISMPTWDRHWLGRACTMARQGRGRWVHSVKTNDAASVIKQAWDDYQAEAANAVSMPLYIGSWA